MDTDLFPSGHGVPVLPIVSMEELMAEELKGYPASDAEALIRISHLRTRRRCCDLLMEYRDNCYLILPCVETIVRQAVARRLQYVSVGHVADVLRYQLRPYNIERKIVSFYMFVVSLTSPDLATRIQINTKAVRELRKVGWKP